MVICSWYCALLASWSSVFFQIWNHDGYQSFQVAVKFDDALHDKNNVASFLLIFFFLFLWRFHWGVPRFGIFNIQHGTRGTFRIMTCVPFVRHEATKLKVEKSWLSGSTYILEEIRRLSTSQTEKSTEWHVLLY